MYEPFLLTIVQRSAAVTDPRADAELVAGFVEAAADAHAGAAPGRHLVLVSSGDESLRELSRMPEWGRAEAREAEARFVRAAERTGAVILEPHRVDPLMWRLHDADGSRDVDAPMLFSGSVLRDTAWLGDFGCNPIIHWRSTFRRELWSLEERVCRGRGVTVTTSPAGASKTGIRIRVGASAVYAEDGTLVAKLSRWTAGAFTLHVKPLAEGRLELKLLDEPMPSGTDDPEIVRLEALETAIKTFVASVGNRGVVIGLSGGIDSALSAALAVNALGADRVTGVMLASRYTSDTSRELVKLLTANLGLPYVERSIETVHDAMSVAMAEDFGGIEPGGIPDQNLQARIRGTWLMGISNATGRIMLCNANKAECAMGYGTLYGDIAGGFAPLSDLWKREVVELARAVNRRAGHEVIPEAIITREPTAELRVGQRDSDSLPPYDKIESVISTKALRWPEEAPEDPEECRILRLFGAMRFKRAQAPAFPQMSPMPLSRVDARWPEGASNPFG